MRISRPTTLLHLLLGLRASTASTTATATATATQNTLRPLCKSPPSPLLPLTLPHPYPSCAATNLYSTFQKQQPYTTMSSSTTTNQPQTQSQPQEESQSQNKPILALPDSSSVDPTVPQLDVNGDGVKLDHLGPLVVNSDGTLSRIGNWAQMTEIEKRNTLRVLGKRNRERREALQAKAEQEQGGAKQE
ncbi:hypothetical protein BJX61DRAFT_322920 [Aspergillus egyptiacus]|nr:hypothetical protein BJX61DRAFT_322920 [Aspergillus egyptiacus]